MPDYETLDLSIDDRGVARLTLDRPEARNAMSQEMIVEMRAAARRLTEDEAVRVVVLSGSGNVFCAGGDLKGMQRQASATREGRIADATEFAETLNELDTLPKLIIGRINGSAYGGGLGLISLCDVAIGLVSSKFCMTEVTLGLIPSVISPYVVARMGVPNARRSMLPSFVMDGDQAVRFGLLSAAVEPDALDDAVDDEIARFLRCAPGAVAACKRLIQFVGTHDVVENMRYTADALADAWESAECHEGIAAFLEKRKPKWRADE